MGYSASCADMFANLILILVFGHILINRPMQGGDDFKQPLFPAPGTGRYVTDAHNARNGVVQCNRIVV